MKPLRPLLFLVSMLLIVGLACSGGATPSTQAPPPTQPVQVIPTEAPPEPTEVPPTEAPPTEVVTEAPVSQAQQFFTEEFDTPLSGDWNVFTITDPNASDLEKVTVEADNGNLVWNLDSEYVYYYLFYNAFEYEDVKVEARADNRG